MKKPIIGITSEIINLGIEYHQSYRIISLNEDYKNLIEDRGAIPMIIPMTKDLGLIKHYMNICDGFLFTGGADINPVFYDENPNNALGVTDYDRDNFEIQLMKEALENDKAILAICRGMQVLNVAKGGNLIQHIPDNKNYFNHMTQGTRGEVSHSVEFMRGNLLHEIFGEKIYVNSSHHQAINLLGNDIEIMGKSEDGIIEAVQLKSNSFVYGVQWHPEEMINKDKDMYLLVDKFLEASLI